MYVYLYTCILQIIYFLNKLQNCNNSWQSESSFGRWAQLPELNKKPTNQPTILLLCQPAKLHISILNLLNGRFITIREGAKNTLRGVVQNHAAFGRKWVPPHLSVRGTTPPPQFSGPASIPPSFDIQCVPPQIEKMCMCFATFCKCYMNRIYKNWLV